MTDLAGFLHDTLCDNREDCRRWGDPRHRGYYEDHAKAIHDRLEPEIGSANVKLVIEVLIEELW